MASFETTYPGSPENRNYNLALAASTLSGKVIRPGQVFSFNRAVGQADKAQGYKKAGVFVGDRIVQGYGGGVCQVSSTLYNAAVRAGLPIVQRKTHGMTVPYLPPGQDATIYYPYLDLKFRNDTGAPINIRAGAKGPSVWFALYGPHKGPETRFETQVLGRQPFRVVRIPDGQLPEGTEKVQQGGLAGIVVHTWLHQTWPDGRKTVKDLGVSRYRPSPRVITVGTKKVKPMPKGAA